MSYDVSIGDDYLNYTFNLSKLFYDHIPAERDRGGLHELDGVTGAQAVELIAKAIAGIDRTYCTVGDAGMRAKYDAPNGRGSALGATIWLSRLLICCNNNRRKRVRVLA